MALNKIRAKRALHYFVAAIAVGVLVTPSPASAVTLWGQHCREFKYVLMQDEHIYACDLTSETFFTCYYSCSCHDC